MSKAKIIMDSGGIGRITNADISNVGGPVDLRDPANKQYVDELIALIPLHEREAVFTIPGALVIGAQSAFQIYPVTRNANITNVTLLQIVAGSDTSSIFDLNKNDVTMYTTQANRPTAVFGDGNGKVYTCTLPDIVSVAAGDFLTVDIDAIETDAIGAVLIVTLEDA
jgi:hypothetical protein